MKNRKPPTWLGAIFVGLIAVCFLSVTNWLLASPTEQITQAVSASGTEQVKQAKAETFLDALSSVLVSVPKKDSVAYVEAATKLRPDLKDDITGTADDVYGDAQDNDDTDRRRVSRHRRKVPVCCNCRGNDEHTMYIPPRQVREYLARHPECRLGKCDDD